MNCSHCGKALTTFNEIQLIENLGPHRLFCDRACLRAWLGPDRPLTERIAKAQSAAAAPQHVVVNPDPLSARKAKVPWHKAVVLNTGRLFPKS